LPLNPGQFTQHRYQPLEFQAVHQSLPMLKHNGNIRDSTAVVISGSIDHGAAACAIHRILTNCATARNLRRFLLSAVLACEKGAGGIASRRNPTLEFDSWLSFRTRLRA
jgi:hypothetical protein